MLDLDAYTMIYGQGVLWRVSIHGAECYDPIGIKLNELYTVTIQITGLIKFSEFKLLNLVLSCLKSIL